MWKLFVDFLDEHRPLWLVLLGFVLRHVRTYKRPLVTPERPSDNPPMTEAPDAPTWFPVTMVEQRSLPELYFMAPTG